MTKTHFSDISNSPLGIRGIELLSPAKNLECGIAAINHGADAVYIGASRFGARAAAGNSIADIEELARYAHRFRAKVFVALNTVLTDDQLPEAEKLIHEIYQAGADALIVQDMGILKMNLPPIALHASTQTDNRSPEKVKFLQNVGFSRVVLARELTLNQIESISEQTHVELEAFVHGALCVSYSGQCYMSQAMCGRSANRGQCAQYCRLPYHLMDADGEMLVKNKHLLSLKDLDQSDALEEMIAAGVTSLKIEGRLKDIEYVKNITAYYRKKLDAIIDGNSSYKRASAGRTTFFFEPNPEKSFRRGSTDYFLHDRHTEIIQPNTPKSLGELIGPVTYVGRNFLEVKTTHVLNNGDGLCYVNKQGDLSGFRLNRVEGKKLFPADMPTLQQGVMIYRNQDMQFEKLMKNKTAERKVGVSMLLTESADGFILKLTDEAGVECSYAVKHEKQLAQKPETVQDNIRNQLSKLGNTIYEATDIRIELSEPWFFPASLLSEWRRLAIEELEQVREAAYVRESAAPKQDAHFPEKKLSYLGNVTNKLSEEFYKEHGVDEVMPGFEIVADKDVALMFTKYCVKFEMGWCPKQGYKATFKEPLFLKNNDQLYKLTFDCKACEMRISKG
ncbi:MAG: hypothetical protein RIS29_144 [Bacteroidota bacterium]|jgi:putative protease